MAMLPMPKRGSNSSGVSCTPILELGPGDSGVIWRPVFDPPHPHSLITQSRNFLSRVKEAMATANAGINVKPDLLPHYDPLHGVVVGEAASAGGNSQLPQDQALVASVPPESLLPLHGPSKWKNASSQRETRLSAAVVWGDKEQPSPVHTRTSIVQQRGSFEQHEDVEMIMTVNVNRMGAQHEKNGPPYPYSSAEDMAGTPHCNMLPPGGAEDSVNQAATLHLNMLPLGGVEDSVNQAATLHCNILPPGGAEDSMNQAATPHCNMLPPEGAEDSVDQAATLHCNMLKQLHPVPMRKGHCRGRAAGSAPSPATGSEADIMDMGKMEGDQLEEVRRSLGATEEVAMTLIYADKSSQLRRAENSKKHLTEAKPKPLSVGVAYPVMGSAVPVLCYVMFPLVISEEDKSHVICRNILVPLLARSRVITYGGQELIGALLSTCDIPPTVWKNWCPLDVGLGAWLLDPDHTPTSFSELLARYGLQQMGRKGGAGHSSALCQDLALLGPLMVKIYEDLQVKQLLHIFLEVEIKLIPILAAMSIQGLKVNCSKLVYYEEVLKKKILQVEVSAHKAAGRHFHINSTSQLREILFDELHLDKNRKLSKTPVRHQNSTSEAVLNQLSHLHPLPKLVLEYRHLCKIHATYISGIMPYIDQGVLKPTWLHISAATGRLIACNPVKYPRFSIKLGVVQEQFIVGKPPVEVEIHVRELIESRPGFTLLAADFKSIELRVLAHLCGDLQLLSAFNSSQATDIFIHLASEWLGVETTLVTAAERERTKHVVYAVIYGVGQERLGEIMKEPPAVAKALIQSFLARFPAVQNYINETISECRLKGYLSTIGQRRRWFPQIISPQPNVKSRAERQAVNFPVQGSAADICKVAMIKVTEMLAKISPESRLLVQIHDELLIEIPDEEVASISGKIKEFLEAADTLPYKLKVPLQVKVSTGQTWASLAN